MFFSFLFDRRSAESIFLKRRNEFRIAINNRLTMDNRVLVAELLGAEGTTLWNFDFGGGPF